MKIGLCGAPLSGKCLGIDTPIIKFDGTVEKVQNIKVGDLLMGPDSMSRKVESVCTGKEVLYKISPLQGGDSFICNESHILSLKLSGSVHLNSRRLKDGLLNISIKDYLQLPKSLQSRAKLWRTGVEFKQDAALPMTPYFLGVWLGDGSSAAAHVTTMDLEIKEAVLREAENLGLFVNELKIANNRASTYKITSRRQGGNDYARNPILGHLQKLNLIDNKHIPQIYKSSNRKSRLEVLAGLIDTDGYNSHNTHYELTQKSKVLAEDIVFLARSLGFYVSLKPVKKYCYYKGEKRIGQYYRININGNVDEIPCRLKRKKISRIARKRDFLLTGFTLENLGAGDYYGFELSGSDRLFLLGDFTVTHNTTLGAMLYTEFLKQGVEGAALVDEYAKYHLATGKTIKEFKDQKWISAHQILNEYFMDKTSFDPIICDSCVWLGKIYSELNGWDRDNNEHPEYIKTLYKHKYDQIIYVSLQSGEGNVSEYRVHTGSQSLKIAKLIENELKLHENVLYAPLNYAERDRWIEEFVQRWKKEYQIDAKRTA